jgi:hypothetical protein
MDDDDRLVSFIAPCPNGHMPSQSFRADVLRSLLDAGHLRFSCITCDEHWDATPAELIKVREHLERS